MQSLSPLVKKFEENRGSKAIIYITGGKPPIFSTKVANDVLPLFRQILEKISPRADKISLLLDTTGGNLDTPWPLVNLVREYCNKFEVVVAERALSAGTLISLGADKIVMQPYSHLSPIDPATEIIDTEKKQQKRIEIEDIIGYIDFAKKKIGIKDQIVLGEVMKELGREINPTMLGSTNRTHSLIRSLSRNLIGLHETKIGKKQTDQIIDYLTEKLFSHSHLINRKEARGTVGFGEIIEFADIATQKATEELFNFYSEYLELSKQFNPEAILGEKTEINYKLPRAIVHSSDIQFTFSSNYVLSKIVDAQGTKVNINNNNNQWEKVNLNK